MQLLRKFSLFFDRSAETSNITIKIGTVTFNDANVKPLPISYFISHPGYNASETFKRDDVALIRLKSPITFTNLTRPICLPKEIMGEKKLMSFRYCVISGQGMTDKGFERIYCEYDIKSQFKIITK